MLVQFRVRRGTTLDWSNENPVLAEGEPGIDVSLHQMKVGDGVTPWNDLAALGGGTGGGGGGPADWNTLLNKPNLFPPTPHQHQAVDVVNLLEVTQDNMAATLSAGPGMAITYDDAAGIITLTSTVVGGGGGTLDAEAVQDIVGTLIVGTGLITATYNDATNTLTISTGATANSTDAFLRNRTNHTGTQATSTVTGLDTALASKVDTTTMTTTLRSIDGVIFYNTGSSSYPLRNTVTTDALRRVRWVGPVSPTIGGGYAITGLDVWEKNA